MKTSIRLLVASLLLLPLTAVAQSPPIVAAAPEVCANIKWNVSFLERYPKAPAACRGVEVRAGLKYAKFMGKVAKTGASFVEVKMMNVANDPISDIGFEVGVGGRVTVNDKVEKVSQLKEGDVLTFWVREGVFGVSPTLTDEPMRIIKPEAGPAK